MSAAKKRKSRTQPPLSRLRKVCLSFPEAEEVEAWGEPTFRVRNKMFAMYAAESSHHGGGRPGVWMKATRANQDLLLHARPKEFFFPPYVGPSGWIGAFLDRRPSWTLIAELLDDAYRLAAPKKLVAGLPSRKV